MMRFLRNVGILLPGAMAPVYAIAPGGLVLWQAEAKPGRPTIVFFHGNGGHMLPDDDMLPLAEAFLKRLGE